MVTTWPMGRMCDDRGAGPPTPACSGRSSSGIVATAPTGMPDHGIDDDAAGRRRDLKDVLDLDLLAPADIEMRRQGWRQFR